MWMRQSRHSSPCTSSACPESRQCAFSLHPSRRSPFIPCRRLSVRAPPCPALRRRRAHACAALPDHTIDRCPRPVDSAVVRSARRRHLRWQRRYASPSGSSAAASSSASRFRGRYHDAFVPPTTSTSTSTADADGDAGGDDDGASPEAGTTATSVPPTPGNYPLTALRGNDDATHDAVDKDPWAAYCAASPFPDLRPGRSGDSVV